MEEENNTTAYMTYNGLNRPAMVKGIPLMLGLVVCFIAVVGGFFSVFIFGFKGFIFPALCVLFLFVVRVMCENDPNALSVIKMELNGVILKIKHGDIIVGFSSVE